MAMSRLLLVAESLYVCVKVGASAEMSPQTAKETAKAVVEKKSARAPRLA